MILGLRVIAVQVAMSSEQERVSSGWNVWLLETVCQSKNLVTACQVASYGELHSKTSSFMLTIMEIHTSLCRLSSLKHCLRSFRLCHFYMNLNEWCFSIFWRGSWAFLGIKKLNCFWWFVHKPHLIAFQGLNINLLENIIRKELFPPVSLVSTTDRKSYLFVTIDIFS